MTYTDEMKQKILPQSVSEDIVEAVKEWSFAGKTVDHGKPCENCQICSQKDLRYHFYIENKKNGNVLKVGSSCILKFSIPVYEDGKLLTLAETKKALNEHKKKMHHKACVRSIEKLIPSIENEKLKGIVKNALKYYRKNKILTPRFAHLLIWQLKSNKVHHNPKYFKIKLNSDLCKDGLRDLIKEDYKVKLIWPSLTSSQKKIALRMGYNPNKKSGKNQSRSER